MLRLVRLLATLVVLLGLLPCEMREAMPVVGELVASCCADEVEAGEHGEDDGSVDCCDTTACLCAARATAPMPVAELQWQVGYLLTDPQFHLIRPDWLAGPPPTPPPIA